MATDLSDPRLYDQASPEDRLAFLQQQLGYIAVAAQQAKARGDTADLANILADFKHVAQLAAQLTGAVNQAAQPSAFMTALSNFSDDALTAGKAVGGAFLDTATNLKDLIDALLKAGKTGTDAASTLLKFLPWLIVAVVVVILVVLFRARKFGIAGVGSASR